MISGAALALGGAASQWLGPATSLPAVIALYLLFGVFLGTVNPPITNTAISGMPRSMAGVAASLASTGRQTGTTLGVAVSGTIVGSAVARGGTAFTTAAHGVRRRCSRRWTAGTDGCGPARPAADRLRGSGNGVSRSMAGSTGSGCLCAAHGDT